MTTKADHNGIHQRPIPTDVLEVPAQVNDGARQSGRILQAEGQGFESPKLHSYQANAAILTMDRGARAIKVP